MAVERKISEAPLATSPIDTDAEIPTNYNGFPAKITVEQILEVAATRFPTAPSTVRYTPSIYFYLAQTGSFTVSIASGRYARSGAMVVFSGTLLWSAKPSAGVQLVFSVPFAPSERAIVNCIGWGTPWAIASPSSGIIEVGETVCSVVRPSASGYALFNRSDIPASGALFFSGSYLT